MYEDYYGLNSKPFRLGTDLRMFFSGGAHGRALSYLRHGTAHGEGFVVVTGAPGTGKTMLAEMLVAELDPETTWGAQLVATQLEPDDLLRMVAAAFELSYQGQSRAELLHTLEQFCAQRARDGLHTLLVVDEAQNLPAESLQILIHLAGYHYKRRSVLQIVLVGQEGLETTLQAPGLEGLRQRIVARQRLQPMAAEETRYYVVHRLQQAGWRDRPAFDESSFEAIHTHSQGVPRRVNMLCDRLLLYGYLEGLTHIQAETVRAVVQEADFLSGGGDGGGLGAGARGTSDSGEVQPLAGVVAESRPVSSEPPRRRLGWGWAIGAVVLLGIGGVILWAVEAVSWQWRGQQQSAVSAAGQEHNAPAAQDPGAPGAGLVVRSPGALLQPDVGEDQNTVANDGSQEAAPAPQADSAPETVQTEQGNDASAAVGNTAEDSPEAEAVAPQADDDEAAESLPSPAEPSAASASSGEVEAEGESSEAKPSAGRETLSALSSPPAASASDPRPRSRAAAGAADEGAMSTDSGSGPDQQGQGEPAPSDDDAKGSAQQGAADRPAEAGQTETAVAKVDKPASVELRDISDSKLNSFVAQFKKAYNTGDRERFARLFAENARAGDAQGRETITERYASLFDNTDSRDIVVNDLQWEVKGDRVRGQGTFELEIQPRRSRRVKAFEGSIIFYLARTEEERLLIQELDYSYNR